MLQIIKKRDKKVIPFVPLSELDGTEFEPLVGGFKNFERITLSKNIP